ncbi:MAG TPA: prepilin-type N-terminal cleavage/methylation domain-containing protein [Candidatus Sumerlaeota bacterium]|nr:prepilin-type N-terminal cleavage/methylation domain-containing protein [Candidatus Sumerlaeota bacterium]HON50987.1 prepilin-type N-terminal cleavage/methylation domain-containing protein [Candidatus Sumerlaeota bacterium]HOR65757.1 prepilin-type N-terminal cleavage/methylation domain-containing protein [Candidatus Sumerlaeota bacterium]HPL75513.1 prepilin-type N-terminal cleavage/methylation domain-containing protein [Candidatus Sumerlaeota bacterium]HRU55113.1 prepilin-type N-terminal cle
MFRRFKGFTLIELLIVVAIIAILAAIAVPNFLEAQVRSKVTKMKANLRTVATALESYFTDSNRYPFTTHPPFWPSSPQEERWKVYPGALTTPVKYVSSDEPMIDVFRAAHGFKTRLANQIMYLPSNNYTSLYTGTNTSVYAAQVNRYGYWTIRSAGPDTWYQNYFGMKGDYDAGGWGQASYDPTNGTVSGGDIYRSQKRADEQHI